MKAIIFLFIVDLPLESVLLISPNFITPNY
jgi:hypothetical protein